MSDTEGQLLAVSAVDGRYASKTEELRPIVSEFGLIRYRVAVEAGWLATLGTLGLEDMPALGDRAVDTLREIPENFTVEDAKRVKEIESTINHDVKAVELWLKEQLQDDEAFSGSLEMVHFGCTSEDITNLAYAMMMRDIKDKILAPNLENIEDDLLTKARDYGNIPLLARTHGQPATPTTLGKEMAVFGTRIGQSLKALGSVAILGKFNGATGNYSAAEFAYPEINWPQVSRKFVENLGFEFNPATTQVEPHDWMARFFNETHLGNTILTDLSRDMWTYISNGVFRQRVVKDEVGSSTMPHKVNPIDFENAEANFGLANAGLEFLAGKLPISRLQRDLSDSSAQRAVGEIYGHNLIAYKSLRRGLGKVEPNTEEIASELDSEWSVLTEAVQTVLRRHGVTDAYEIIKEATRGKELTEAGYHELVERLDGIPQDTKDRLLALTPATYTGKATDITKD